MAETAKFSDVDDYDLSVSLSEDQIILHPDDDCLAFDAETAIAIGEKLIELGRAVIAQREEAGE